MQDDELKSYEEIWISAYCRLSFMEWFKLYKDDMGEAWTSENALYQMLNKCAAEDNKTIRVDAVACKASMGMETCLESCLYYLARHEDISIVCEVPYEEQKSADKYAYDYIHKKIRECEFSALLYNDYVIKVSFLPEMFRFDTEEAFILKPDKTCLCLHYSEEDGLKQMSLPIKNELYQKIIVWSKKYAKTHNHEPMCGLIPYLGFNKYTVNFNIAYLGIKSNLYTIQPYEFGDLTRDDPISELMRLPDIKEFRKRSNKR